jgi:hypothetical protein
VLHDFVGFVDGLLELLSVTSRIVLITVDFLIEDEERNLRFPAQLGGDDGDGDGGGVALAAKVDGDGIGEIFGEEGGEANGFELKLVSLASLVTFPFGCVGFVVGFG